MNRPVLIGQAPSRSSDPENPLAGRSGSVLAAAAGIAKGDFLAAFDRYNLFQEWPGSATGKGDAFDWRAARATANDMVHGRLAGRCVVLLGRNVAKAFLFTPHAKAMEWHRLYDCLVAMLPHPSGVNLWWNDEANRAQARRFLRSLLTPELRRKRCRSKAT